MAKPNWENRTMFMGDNLLFMRAMDSGTVDLIATDPPFNKKRNFHAMPASGKFIKFKDSWPWENHMDGWLEDIRSEGYENLAGVIDGARLAHSEDMGSFLIFIGVRLVEMRRLLKSTGSLFLHCDHSAGHYIRAALDAVFGADNFRNEIIWSYKKWSNDIKGFQRNHDTIFWYVKTPRAVYNTQYGPPTENQIKLRKKGYNPGSNNQGQKIVRIYDKDNPVVKEKLPLWELEGRRIYYVNKPLQGKALSDVWPMPIIGGYSSERMRWPTQKPIALYKRIVEAASNAGDVIFDPFGGCATTCVAAEQLKRSWVGSDIWPEAEQIIKDRLATAEYESAKQSRGRKQPLLDAEDIMIRRKLPVRSDGGETAITPIEHKVGLKEIKLKDGFKDGRAGDKERKEYLLLCQGRHGPRCDGCNRQFTDPADLQLDHMAPQKDGGADLIINRCLLCAPCNRDKGADLTLSGLVRKNKKPGGRWIEE